MEKDKTGYPFAKSGPLFVKSRVFDTVFRKEKEDIINSQAHIKINKKNPKYEITLEKKINKSVTIMRPIISDTVTIEPCGENTTNFRMIVPKQKC